MLQQISADGAAPLVALETGERRLYFGCKRCLDLCAAAVLLALLSPLLLLIAIAIKLDSAGPAIFAQERVGARRRQTPGGSVWEIRHFRCYKFRTMFHGADQSLHQRYIRQFVGGVTRPQGPDATFKLHDDPRVTRVGRVLRKSSLDELPQLLNVLRGEMSLVGPRPVPVYEVAEYRPEHYRRLAALPGITGLWQVTGRCQVSFEEMIALDVEYIRRRSLALDCKLLLLTIPAVLSARGAD